MSAIAGALFFVVLFQFSSPQEELQLPVADIANYPFIVSLRFNDQHQCGGSIISETAILTAAHCLVNAANFVITIRVGSSRHAEGLPYDVDRYISHPSHNDRIMDYDVALLHLVQPLMFGENVQMAMMARNRLPVYVVGWGKIFENSTTSEVLEESVAQVNSVGECGRMVAYVITDRMVCVFSMDGGNMCPGYSGGPLVNALAGNVVGVASFGLCRDILSVYASVPDLVEWILENMNF